MNRVLISDEPYLDDANLARGVWPCRWISCPDADAPPFVAAYRLRFDLEHDVSIRIHVSADERYELFLDGARIGRGPERGDPNHWPFETYDLTLPSGEHVLVARVWALGELAPYAQMSVRPGFLLSPDNPEFVTQLGTGAAPWEAKRLGGYEFLDPRPAFGSGAKVRLDGSRFDWGFERGEADGWHSATPLHEGSGARRNEFAPLHLLTPALLPPMMEEVRRLGKVRLVSALPFPLPQTHAIPVREADHILPEAAGWQQLLDGGALTIPPHTRRRVLIDLEDYLCAYPEIVTSGGAKSGVRIHWQESLYDDANASSKGNRDDIEGKFFTCIWWPHDGMGDTFLPDGGAHRRFDTLWWECGRWIEIVVETREEPLVLEGFTLRETRYPLENEGVFACSDERLGEVNSLALRTLQVCLHETFFDCPYYEQLNYVGDTRVELLTSYVVTRDDRFARKALQLFDASRLPSGLTQSRFPSRIRNVIPPYALWHIGLVYDFALWRGDAGFVRSLMPGVRGVLDAFLTRLNADGLIEAPEGWNNMDWVPAWEGGVPPDAQRGVSGVLNWQFVLALRWAAELEEWLGETELAARARRLSGELAARVAAAFWNEDRQLFADDLAHLHFSEHAQCLAILGGQLPAFRRAQVGEALLNDANLSRATLYFSHYLFEAFHTLGQPDALLNRLNLWFDLPAQGFKTTPEMPEPSRSDCHAWSAHSMHHSFSSLLGIRPCAMGFEKVEIAPQLGSLSWARGMLPHPSGTIEVELHRENGNLRGHITLPPALSGTFVWAGQTVPLHAGRQEVQVGGERASTP